MIRALMTALALTLPLLPAPLRAAGAVDPAKVVHAELLPGWRMADGHRMAALKLSLAPGWHTYWRAPGEAGIPPSFDWSGSENLKSVAIRWPVPQVFDLGGMRSIGYKGAPVLPLELTPKDPAKPIVLKAKVALGVCQDICLPAELEVSADLSGRGAKNGAISAALANGPESAAKAGVTGATCAVEPIADGLRLTATLKMPAIGPKEVAVVELPDPSVWVSEATTKRTGGELQAVADIVPSSQPFALDRSKLVITVLAPGRAVELHGCPG